MTTNLDPPAGIIREVVALALREDFGLLGDLTSIAVIPEDAYGTGRFVSRIEAVLAGTAAASEVFRQVDTDLVVAWTSPDGSEIRPGVAFGSVSGSLRSILSAERTALKSSPALFRGCNPHATLRVKRRWQGSDPRYAKDSPRIARVGESCRARWGRI